MRIDTHTHIYICYVHTIHGISKSSSAYRIQEPINVANCTMKPYHFLRLITSLKRAAVSLSLCIYIYTHTNLCKYNRYIRMYIHTYNIPIHVRLYIFTCSHTHTRSQTHTHTHTHTHIYIYIYICIRMHTCAWMAGFGLGIWTSSPPRRL